MSNTKTYNYVCVCTLSAGWTASRSDPEKYIQADFGSTYLLHSVTTQGRGDFNEWTTSYTVSYGDDGTAWTLLPATYTANTNRHTKVTNELPANTFGRFIRLHIVTYLSGPALRWDVIGKEPRKSLTGIAVKVL